MNGTIDLRKDAPPIGQPEQNTPKKKKSGTVLVIIAFWLVAVMPFFWGHIKFFVNTVRYDKTTASVTEIKTQEQILHNDDGEEVRKNYYTINYVYEYNGNQYSGVYQGYKCMFSENEVFDVYVNPDSPNIVQLPDKTNVHGAVMIIPAFFTLIAGILIYAFVKLEKK